MLFYYLFVVFFFGLILGSFANVCIHRIPRDESIIFPGSHCPSCNNLIAWYDNIPVLSYFVLRGKCRRCSAKISLQYPAVEFLTACMFLLVAIKFPFDPVIFLYLYFTFVLVVISGIDIFWQIIPDFFSLSLIAVGLASSAFNSQLGPDVKSRILNSLIGTLTGGGFLLVMGWLGELAFKKEAMGGGDVKLLAGVGALLGWHKALSTIIVASFLGSIIGITLILVRKLSRKDYIPFGPFIASAAYLNVFLPDPQYLLAALWLRP
jgi:leader peptidase (prepilin peptidase) / N-methyltransferase